MLISFSALANTTPKPTGSYLDANVGYGKVNQTINNAPKNDNSGFAWNVNAGYKFTPNWAVEMGYTRYADLDFGNVPGYGPTKSIQPYTVHFAAKGIYPAGDKISLFGKLGLAYVASYLPNNIPAPNGDFTLSTFAGIGASYAITNNLEFKVEASGIGKTARSPSIYLGTVGLGYTFGKPSSPHIFPKKVKTKESGIYTDGNIGYGGINKTINNAPKKDTYGFAWNINSGYKFNRYFATELGYARYANQNFGNVPGYGDTRGSETYSIHLAAKGILPVIESFSLFGKFGLAYAHQHQSGSNDRRDSHYFALNHNLPFYGAIGAAYSVTNNVDVILSAEGTASDKRTPQMYSGTIGLGYIF